MRYTLIALLLAGCISTPQELVEGGERAVLEVSRPPEDAAGCIARNIENWRHYQTTIRPIDAGTEVLVRSEVHNIAVIHVRPKQATFWMRAIFIGRDEFARVAVMGC